MSPNRTPNTGPTEAAIQPTTPTAATGATAKANSTGSWSLKGIPMNKKFVGLALVATAVGGYVYYRYNRGEIEKKLQQLEDKAAAALLNWQAKGQTTVDDLLTYQAKAVSPPEV